MYRKFNGTLFVTGLNASDPQVSLKQLHLQYVLHSNSGSKSWKVEQHSCSRSGLNNNNDWCLFDDIYSHSIIFYFHPENTQILLTQHICLTRYQIAVILLLSLRPGESSRRWGRPPAPPACIGSWLHSRGSSKYVSWLSDACTHL